MISKMMQFLDPKFLIEAAGLFGIIAIIFAESGLFFGFFLPGDSLLFTAGLLASQSLLNLWILYFGALLAAILGDAVGFWFGKKAGPKIFTKEDSFFFNKAHITRSEKFFAKYGKKAIILARFMPIIRTFTPILAGVGNMPYKIFFSYNVIGGFIWVTGMVFGGYWFGKLIPDPDRFLLPILGIIILVSILPAFREWLYHRKKQ